MYGSKATKKKVLLGKVTNYFSNLQVGEFKIESFDLQVGEDILIQGPTTGTLEIKVWELRLDLDPVQLTLQMGGYDSGFDAIDRLWFFRGMLYLCPEVYIVDLLKIILS